MPHATVPQRRASPRAVKGPYTFEPSRHAVGEDGAARPGTFPPGPIGRRRAAVEEARAERQHRVRQRWHHVRAGIVSVAGLLTLTIGLSALPAAASFGSAGGARPNSAAVDAVAAPVATVAAPLAVGRLGRSHAGDALVLRQVPVAGYSRVALPTPDESTRAAVVAEWPTATPTLPPTPKPTPKPTKPPTPAPTDKPKAKPAQGPAAGGGKGCGNCAFSGSLVWPVAGGEMSQGYHGGHEAIDIWAAVGTPVLAAAQGEVIFSGWKDNGGGWQVWLRHGDVITTYNHMDSVAVRTGAWVGAGQRVGRVGATGWSTGPHLHFEVWIGIPWRGGYPVNPLKYL